MKNDTLRLFEYLLAAKNRNVDFEYNLSKSQRHWFLDELLSFSNVKLKQLADGITCISMHRPPVTKQHVEVSALLVAILELMQYQETDDQRLLISKDELEKTIRLEANAIKSKIEAKDCDTIIINDWQQLLLGVNKAQVPITVAIRNAAKFEAFIQQVSTEYQEWQTAIALKKVAENQLIKEQTIYDEILKLANEDYATVLELGVGILQIPGEPAINYPLLTAGINIIVSPVEEMFDLVFKEPTLSVSEIINYLLFHDLKTANKIKYNVNMMKINPLDDSEIAPILQKIRTLLHPDMSYINSPLDEAQGTQLLHRSVLSVRKSHPDRGLEKLEAVVNALSAGNKPADAILSITDPNYSCRLKSSLNELDDALFIESTAGIEGRLLNLLQQHNTVVAFEETAEDKISVIANIITNLIASGKRILIVGEATQALIKIQTALPAYLDGIYNELSPHKFCGETLKKALTVLFDKRAYYNLADLKTQKTVAEIKEITAQLTAMIAKIVDYRELGSKKIFWKGKRYYPYELAQLISKLGGKYYLAGDNIEPKMRFEMKNSEIQKFWELRPYFTRENLALLNYDFIDPTELKNYHEYQKMLLAQANYLKLEQVGAGFKSVLDNVSDIRFVQYLFDQLPKLIQDVAQVKTNYSKQILNKSLASLENFHTTAATLERLNRLFKEKLPADEAADQETALIANKKLINKLNELLAIPLDDLPNLTKQNEAQLLAFYLDKKAEMSLAIQAAHSICSFNEGAIALHNSFKGISAKSLEMMSTLYQAAAFHLSKIEFEICWSRVKAHFTRLCQPLMQQEQLHPVCTDMYEALKNDDINEFNEILTEVENLLKKRQNFLTFGNFICQIGDMMPLFTTAIMSEESFDTAVIPNFKDAFDQAKLNGLFAQLHNYESQLLEEATGYLQEQLLHLQHEALEKVSWGDNHLISQSDLLATIDLVENAQLLNADVMNSVALAFKALFLPLNENVTIAKIDPNLFDLVIFADAHTANITRLTELTHAHKALLFGHKTDKLANSLALSERDFQKLASKFDEKQQAFSQRHFKESLLKLVTNAVSLDAYVKLPKQTASILVDQLGQHVKSGAKRCDNAVEAEIFEALTKLGYEVKCKVKIGKITLDFLVVGQKSALAINVVGDIQMQREEIKSQLEQEMNLKITGLSLCIIYASQFCLNSRKTLMDLRANLEKLAIYPRKK